MKGQYTLTNLTDKSVSILKQKFTEENEQVGKNWRRAYVNNKRGRQKVKNELPSPQKDAIFEVWGDEPTVSDDDED